jgi:glycosyltransferase involved in cell wall biosynthesis
MWFAAHFADRIITDSENSKSDLVEIYDVDPARIQVAYLGYDRQVFNSKPPDPAALKALLTRFEVGRPYLFHHGTIQPRKNLDALIRVHRLLLDRNPELEVDLVLAGPLGWLYESVVQAARESTCSRGRVILTGALDNTDLALLLKGATVSVIPSFYEGFCFPMVEAMACGVPTVVSNSSCLPEVSGGVLRYFSPKEPEEMVEIVSLAIHDSLERQRLREAGMRRAAEFSWRRTGEQTLAVLMDACGTSRVRNSVLEL